MPADSGVLNIVDSLDIGGTEKVAVSIANQLSSNGRRSFLCTTRQQGPLASLVSPSVEQLHLNRTRTIQWKALGRLVEFIREHRIDILHAHSSSILTANLASRFPPYPRIVWHDHFGPNDSQERPVWLYRGLMRRVGGIVAVSQPLADWSRARLRFPSERVWCLPNFVDIPSPGKLNLDLPGCDGSRIVCVANVRPVKDQINLIRAMKRVVGRHSSAHLLLVGGLADAEYVAAVRREIAEQGLREHVSLLGPRHDVPQILKACDLGVLNSKSEGLPLSLLEYGAAGLPVVVTRVGQCADAVDNGRAGLIVPAGQPHDHAEAMIKLLDCRAERQSYGDLFLQRVKQRYSAQAVIQQLTSIYDVVLTS